MTTPNIEASNEKDPMVNQSDVDDKLSTDHHIDVPSDNQEPPTAASVSTTPPSPTPNTPHPGTPIYMFFNAATSISLVLVNKWIFVRYQLHSGTALTAWHFIVTWLGLELCATLGMFTKKIIPIRQMMGLCLSFCGFVVITNLSLVFNSVGFYQMAKVMTTPTIVVIQTLFYNKTFSNPIKLSLAVTCFGIIYASVHDVQLNLLGTLLAAFGVIVTSFYQIWVGTRQRELDVNSMQLLHNQAPISAFMLLFFVPLLDDVAELRTYDWNTEVLFTIFVSGALAFGVNLSTFLVIGKTSPIAYNVLGHFKTCLILIMGFILFGYPIDMRNITGILVALAGIFYYTHLNLRR